MFLQELNPNVRPESQLRMLTFSNLSAVPGLAHGVFTRHGGVSREPFSSLNVVRGVGDDPAAVRENLRRVRESLGLRGLVSAFQVHGEVIHQVTPELLDSSECSDSAWIVDSGDALATDMRGLGLLIKVADCQPIFLVDPVRRVLANVHSGWRGSVANIAGKTVELLRDRYGCRPSDLLAAVGPSLGPCCAEFRNYRTELPESFWGHQVRPTYFDFWAISRHQLEGAGVKPENIEVSGRCTACGTRDFFSYRGEKVTGRLAAVIGWRER